MAIHLNSNKLAFKCTEKLASKDSDRMANCADFDQTALIWVCPVLLTGQVRKMLTSNNIKV